MSARTIAGDRSTWRLNERPPPNARWPEPSATGRNLAHDEVHLVCAHLDGYSSVLLEAAGALSSEEQTRAGEFHFEQDRRRFIARRVLLRKVLGRYLRTSARQVQLQPGINGKLEVAGPASQGTLRFSLSHSGEIALYAVTRAVPIGVDVERVQPIDDLDQITSRFFAPGEAAALRCLPAATRLRAFHQCWTIKEAVLKATGEGIGRGLAGVQVAVTPRGELRLTAIGGQPQAAREWSVSTLVPADGCVAAVACRASSLRTVCFGLERFGRDE